MGQDVRFEYESRPAYRSNPSRKRRALCPPHYRKLNVEEKVVHIPAGGTVQYAEYPLPEHFADGGIRLEGVKIIRVVYE